MPLPAAFARLQEDYARLQEQLRSGRITPEQFTTAVHQLMVQDPQGRYWRISASTGRWYWHDGTQWVPGDPNLLAPAPPPPPPPLPPPVDAPVQAPAPAAQAPPRQGRSGCATCGCILGVLVLVAVLLVGGLYLALRSGAVSVNQLLNLVGQGPALVEINNFRDDTVSVTITRVPGSQNESPSPTSLKLASFDVRNYEAGQPGRYKVQFQASSSALGDCTLTVRGGDRWQFVALPGMIVVTRGDQVPAKGSDYVVATSSLCR